MSRGRARTLRFDSAVDERLAREAANHEIPVAEAIRIYVAAGMKEADRRLDRDARIAVTLAQSLYDIGYEVDGVDVGAVSISLDE